MSGQNLPAAGLRGGEEFNMKYTVRIRVSECQEDTFEITASDLSTAQRDAMTEAVERGYDIDDVIDVVQDQMQSRGLPTSRVKGEK